MKWTVSHLWDSIIPYHRHLKKKKVTWLNMQSVSRSPRPVWAEVWTADATLLYSSKSNKQRNCATVTTVLHHTHQRGQAARAKSRAVVVSAGCDSPRSPPPPQPCRRHWSIRHSLSSEWVSGMLTARTSLSQLSQLAWSLWFAIVSVWQTQSFGCVGLASSSLSEIVATDGSFVHTRKKAWGLAALFLSTLAGLCRTSQFHPRPL